jgi:hypothetical protein
VEQTCFCGGIGGRDTEVQMGCSVEEQERVPERLGCRKHKQSPRVLGKRLELSSETLFDP